ncbi:MAG: PBSX family phage terminase large subunit [Gammaproteobacteria bacterium]|nr:PBSX family phage terminase large subunit [Gammaproteobacteria bacterium]
MTVAAPPAPSTQAVVRSPQGGLVVPRKVSQPKWAGPLYRRGEYRYKVPYGGRGSAKTWTVAAALIVLTHNTPLRIACVREHQKSIEESAKEELENQIRRLGLTSVFRITKQHIDHVNGSHFFFRGLSSVQEEDIKGWANVDICWIEQAEMMSASSWEILDPTIRKPGSEIWATFNPKNPYDPVYKTFVVEGRRNAWTIKVNYNNNPWFKNDTALEQLRRDDQEFNPDRYAHKWLGELDTRGERKVLPYDLGQICVDAWDRWDEDGTVEAGLDVSTGGPDRNALAIKRGAALLDLDLWNEEMLGKTTRRAHTQLSDRGAIRLYYDAGGVGEGVKSHLDEMETELKAKAEEALAEAKQRNAEIQRSALRTDPEEVLAAREALEAAAAMPTELAYQHKPILFGGAVANPDAPATGGHTNAQFYLNRAAQMGWGLRQRALNTQRLMAGRPVDPADCLFINPEIKRKEDLLAQLAQPVWDEGRAGKLQIDKDPDDVASPDAYDGTILAFAHDAERVSTDALKDALQRRLGRIGGKR